MNRTTGVPWSQRFPSLVSVLYVWSLLDLWFILFVASIQVHDAAFYFYVRRSSIPLFCCIQISLLHLSPTCVPIDWLDRRLAV